MAITTLTATLQAGVRWTAQKTITGSDYQPLVNSSNLTKTQDYGNDVANAAVGGADTLASYLLTVAANSTSTIDVTSLTNVLQETGTNFARIKGYMVRLLDTTDDATYGTNCSSVAVGQATSARQDLNLGGNYTFTVKTGGVQLYFDRSAAGFTANNTLKNILVTNGDVTNAGKVQFSVVGGTT